MNQSRSGTNTIEITSAVAAFIEKYRKEDVRQTALSSAASRLAHDDLLTALQQIEGWQKACKKLPSWAARGGIWYPAELSMEQCSSEQTAAYKARLAERLYHARKDGKKEDTSGLFLTDTMVDLTGGFGVDFSFMSRSFSRGIYVERQESLCTVADHNFRLLGLSGARVVCQDGIEYLHQLPHAFLIFMDPARRNSSGGRTYAISDCTPNVLAMEEELMDKADYVILKLSPMLDWHKAVVDLNRKGRVVSEVHLVSAGNECKELLVVLTRHASEIFTVYCVNDNIDFSFLSSEMENITPLIDSSTDLSGHYLYEPNASMMKAGNFALYAKLYHGMFLGQNTHLMVSSQLLLHFPGRVFHILRMVSFNKKALRQGLAGITMANIITRNFPMSVADLRRRLKMSDGGLCYLFATTLGDSRRVLLVAERLTAEKQ